MASEDRVAPGLENLEAGATVTVIVARNGIDQYRELEYQITVGAR